MGRTESMNNAGSTPSGTAGATGDAASEEIKGGYSAEEECLLLEVARDAIAHCLREGEPLGADVDSFPPALRANRASFVSLHLGGDLRGCIGGFEASDPLVVDVAKHACDAAVRDPRFSVLTEAELAELEISISVLGPFEELHVVSEEELLQILRPRVDGVLIEEGALRATFLPSVWEQLPEPRDFLMQLKKKAGIPPDHWSSRICVSRYEVDHIGESEA